MGNEAAQFYHLIQRRGCRMAARGARQPVAVPVVGFIRNGSADASARYVAAFREGLSETGYVEGQNVTVEYHWLAGEQNRLPALLADLVRRQVAVIATLGNVPTLAANAATATIPIASSALATTRSASVSSTASLGLAAMRPASRRWWPSDCNSCMS